VTRIEEQIHGHPVVVQPDPAHPSDADRVEILLGERRFLARLDDDLGYSCSALPFRGYASPLALARALAASHSAGSED